jgi:hypothetical protein
VIPLNQDALSIAIVIASTISAWFMSSSEILNMVWEHFL